MSLFEIYIWTILAGALMGPALSLLGTQIAARDKSMQTLCVGQGATLGVLLGMGLLGEGLWPFATAVIFSWLTYFLGEKLARRFLSSKNTFFSSLFAVLLGLGYLVCAIFPSLENHMTHIFFGDLATLSDLNSRISILIALVIFLVFARYWRVISFESFEIAVFGRTSTVGKWLGFSPFDFLAIFTLTFSVQFLGYLFTIACLFLPTVILKFSRKQNLIRHLLLSSAISVVSIVIGFLWSLENTRMPTVPSIILVMGLIGFVPFTLGVLSQRRSTIR